MRAMKPEQIARQMIKVAAQFGVVRFAVTPQMFATLTKTDCYKRVKGKVSESASEPDRHYLQTPAAKVEIAKA